MKTEITATIDPRNPPAVHEWTGPTGVNFRDVRSAAGTYYHDTTPPAVVAALDSAMQSGARVRFWYGDRETGKSWLDEFDVCGTVGRSTGWKRTALILSNARSHGGPAILADSIVRLMVDGREVYRHPQFNQAALAVSTDPAHLAKGYPAAVLADGEMVARFKSTAAASRWIDFMEGRRACK